LEVVGAAAAALVIGVMLLVGGWIYAQRTNQTPAQARKTAPGAGERLANTTAQPKRMPSPDSQPSPSPRNDRPQRLAGFTDWLQDLEAAKQRAARENKDLFILFDGSDWCGWSIKLAQEVLFQPAFRQRFDPQYILVLIDFPQTPAGKAQVQNAQRNEAVQEHYRVYSYPTVVLADAQGRPYAFDGYLQGGPDVYGEHLAQHQAFRCQRDQLLSAVTQAAGPAQLDKAKETLQFLLQNKLLPFYEPLLQEWETLARRHDGKNERGDYEFFFEMAWMCRLAKVNGEKAGELLELVNQLNAWKQMCRFRDADRAIRLHVLAGRLLAMAGKPEEGIAYVRAAREFRASNPLLEAMLRNPLMALGFSCGSGFIVSADGHLLTNNHVVAGPGRVLVRLLQHKELVAAEVVARDEQRDIALLRLQGHTGGPLAALPVAGGRPLQRGEQVAAFGYPLGESLGSGLKLTKGVVSAITDEDNVPGLLLDIRVNPGNSGGPLCDARGNVVGLVTAKSLAGMRVDSYGMARPAQSLTTFLQQHLKTYKPVSARTRKLEWQAVDHLVNTSVVMVLKAPASVHETRDGLSSPGQRKPALTPPERTGG
jgi:S1-C subfamily serine protease